MSAHPPLALVPHPFRSAPARGRGAPGPLQGPHPDPHRVRPPHLPPVVPRTPPRPTPGGAGPHRALRALDAGSPRLQALDDLPATVGGSRVLPDLRHRRHHSRLHPPSTSAGPTSRQSHRPWACHTCSSRPCSLPGRPLRTSMTSPWSPCSAFSVCGSSRRVGRTSKTSARNTATAC